MRKTFQRHTIIEWNSFLSQSQNTLSCILTGCDLCSIRAYQVTPLVLESRIKNENYEKGAVQNSAYKGKWVKAATASTPVRH